MTSNQNHERTIGLFGATSVGVGAIVGGGILALAGVAFATTGPAAIVAFAINGVIALLTALSFAEMASKFPESGGTYTFSKKVLSVEAAFAVGWVVWFASIVAAVLYAVGFAWFALVMTTDLWNAFGEKAGAAPAWLSAPWMVTGLAVATTVLLGANLIRTRSAGGNFVNVGKLIVFAILVAAGMWATIKQPGIDTSAALKPFFPGGIAGLVAAMGYTFVALQGFDLIAAVGGEVRDPEKNLPRAMVLSLLIALAIYIPFLFVLSAVGAPDGESITGAAAKDPEGIVAVAVSNYLGTFGYWLVIVAAVLSMFSALQANLYAASRISMAMARDRNLPSSLAAIHTKRGTPYVAIVATAALVSLILLVLPDVGAAGAASSLIFLITFALAHGIAFLVRHRSKRLPPPFRTPWFPLVPVVGGFACIALAIFQGIAVPSAGLITVSWLGFGGLLFIVLFARRARMSDVSSRGFNPELATLRGRTPLVLVPIVNPENAQAMIELADALVPGGMGRVLVQHVVVAPDDWNPDEAPEPVERLQAMIGKLVHTSANTGVAVETITTVAPEPMPEIARVAELHRCETVLLGLTGFSESGEQGKQLESLLGTLDCNVVLLRAIREWRLADAKKILIPVGGRGGHEHLMALLLGRLLRTTEREVTFLQVLPQSAKPDKTRVARRKLKLLADDSVRSLSNIEIVQSDDALGTIVEQANASDLLILGIQRIGRRKKLFGDFTRQLAAKTKCPIIAMSRRG